jgi:hypothetical protein
MGGVSLNQKSRSSAHVLSGWRPSDTMQRIPRRSSDPAINDKLGSDPPTPTQPVPPLPPGDVRFTTRHCRPPLTMALQQRVFDSFALIALNILTLLQTSPGQSRLSPRTPLKHVECNLVIDH